MSSTMRVPADGADGASSPRFEQMVSHLRELKLREKSREDKSPSPRRLSHDQTLTLRISRAGSSCALAVSPRAEEPVAAPSTPPSDSLRPRAASVLRAEEPVAAPSTPPSEPLRPRVASVLREASKASMMQFLFEDIGKCSKEEIPRNLENRAADYIALAETKPNDPRCQEWLENAHKDLKQAIDKNGPGLFQKSQFTSLAEVYKRLYDISLWKDEEAARMIESCKRSAQQP